MVKMQTPTVKSKEKKNDRIMFKHHSHTSVEISINAEMEKFVNFKIKACSPPASPPPFTLAWIKSGSGNHGFLFWYR